MAKLIKKLKKSFDEFVEEVWDELEISDYFEDIGEEAKDFFKNFFKPYDYKKPIKNDYKTIKAYGFMQYVRPAYVFAERIDNILKILFSISIITSALVASIWGFTRLSELIEFLITSTIGRIIIFIIGLSYLLIAVWKLLHLKEGGKV
jgi:hypothetical protein